MRKLAFQRHPSRERELRIRLQSEKRGPISIFPLGGKRWGRLMECHAVPDRAQGLPGITPQRGLGEDRRAAGGRGPARGLREHTGRQGRVLGYRGGVGEALLHELRPGPQAHRGLHHEPAVQGRRQRLRARQLRVRDHRRVTEPHPRAGPSQGRVRLQPEVAAVRRRVR